MSSLDRNEPVDDFWSNVAPADHHSSSNAHNSNRTSPPHRTGRPWSLGHGSSNRSDSRGGNFGGHSARGGRSSGGNWRARSRSPNGGGGAFNRGGRDRSHSPPNRRFSRPDRSFNDSHNHSPFKISKTNSFAQEANPAVNPIITSALKSMLSNAQLGIGAPGKEMMTFKNFISQCQENYDEYESIKQYDLYKKNFKFNQVMEHFNANKKSEWFIEAYDEKINADSLLAKQKNVQKRFQIFKTLADEMDIIKNQSVEQTKNQLKLNEILDYAAVMIEGGTIADLEELNKNRRSNANSSDTKTGEKHQEGSIWAQFAPKKSPEHNEEKENEEMQIENDAEVVHKDTFHRNSSLYIADFPDTLTKSDLETFGSNYKGFKRAYVHKIHHARSLKCRAWIIFNDYVKISNICADFNKHVFKDGSKLVANVSREIQYRIRPVTGLTNHSDILLSDLKNAINLVLMFDERWGLFGSSPGKINKNPDLNKISIDSGNPLLAGLSKFIVKEEDYVETLDDNMDIQPDASLAQPKQVENSDFATKAKIQFSTNDEYKAALDPLILYLRIVHSFDFYHGSKFENESEMENVLGVLHARGDMIREELFQSDINEYQLNFSSRIQRYLTHHKELTQDDLDFISFKDIELCVDEFVKKNSLKINDTKWQCLVCNKKFRDNNFLSKHIGNKHNTELDVMKYETKLFNNLLKDSRSISQIVHNFNTVSRKSAAEQLASEMVNSNALAAVNGYPSVNGNTSSALAQFESSEKPLANQNNSTSNANSADLISSAVSQLSSNPMLMATLINQSIMSKNNGIGFANSMGGSSGRFNQKFNDRRAVVNYQDMDTPN